MPTDPRRTIQLLGELSDLGFTNHAFHVLHHMREVTIESHKAYCRRTAEFREGSNNARIQMRLELVLKAYRAGGFQRGEPILVKLSEASVEEIPFVADHQLPEGTG